RRGPDTALDKVQKAAAQLEQAAAEAAAPAARGVTKVQIARPSFDFKDYLLTQMPSIGSGLLQAVVVLFVTFFLLASGDTFRRKMVKLAGPTLARKKITVAALDEITDQIQRYLLVQVWISILVGICTGLAFWALGVEHAAIWGLIAFVLNFVPYIGALVLTAGSALVGFLQFGTVDMALLLAAISVVLHTISGYLLMPWLTSRASRMNAVAVFVGVLTFGWIWGVWGLVLGMPILLMVKTVCDRSDNLKPLGELLSH
ncbi:MAG: AI-2E family transporter, partial [Rubrivivax sp.]